MSISSGLRRPLQMLAALVVAVSVIAAAPNSVRIIQTNSAGDAVSIIDPAE
jgi:hypothetical protein